MKTKYFTKNGWSDYLYQSTHHVEAFKKINDLIEAICENENTGIGKPEPLTGRMQGCWSRRINEKDRLVYLIDQDSIHILSCRFHDE